MEVASLELPTLKRRYSNDIKEKAERETERELFVGFVNNLVSYFWGDDITMSLLVPSHRSGRGL